MRRTTSLKLLTLVGLAALLAGLVSACGVSQGEYDTVKQRAAAKEREATAAQQQLEVQRKDIGNLQQKVQAASAQPPILAAVPNAPPRPTPVPPPPGATPAPAPVAPAAKTVPLYVYHDTVTAGPGESPYNVDANLSCVRTSLFHRGMHVVWRMEILETSTGKILQGADIDRAVVRLASGQEFPFRFGRHGATEDAPWFFTATWDIPMDHPLGVADYVIEIATKTGKRVTVDQPLTVSMPERQIDTRLQIVG